MALEITNDNFEKEVIQSKIPVLLDFWAEWCPPCKLLSPVIDELSETYKGKIKIAKVDVDAAGELAQKFNITSIPTLLLFNNGEIVKNQVGALPKPSIEEMFKDLL